MCRHAAAEQTARPDLQHAAGTLGFLRADAERHQECRLLLVARQTLAAHALDQLAVLLPLPLLLVVVVLLVVVPLLLLLTSRPPPVPVQSTTCWLLL